jgi:DNA repair ATPase RecN
VGEHHVAVEVAALERAEQRRRELEADLKAARRHARSLAEQLREERESRAMRLHSAVDEVTRDYLQKRIDAIDSALT